MVNYGEKKRDVINIMFPFRLTAYKRVYLCLAEWIFFFGKTKMEVKIPHVTVVFLQFKSCCCTFAICVMREQDVWTK